MADPVIQARCDALTVALARTGVDNTLNWLRESYECALRTAAKKAGADRDGWIMDAAFLAHSISLIEHATGRNEGDHHG